MSSPEATFNGSPDNAQKGTEQVKKRKRGATRLSCAECRRLKLRCDRAIPCGSCVKRGCAAICPDGSLTTGKGNRATRFVLASTQDLHEKILELSNRVRDLEDALRVSHAKQTQDLHPLLAEDLLRIKAPIQRDGMSLSGANGGAEETGNDVVDSFGSLSISENGRTKWFGQGTSSWYFLQNESQQEQERDDRLSALRRILPMDILGLAGFFPIAPSIPATLDVEAERIDRLRSLFWYLPPADEAADLRQYYFQHAAWMYSPFSEDSFNDLVFYQFYNPNALPPIDDPLLSHHLALMFMVLAIGSLMDMKREAHNIEAEKYHQLARAALFQSPIFEEPTIHAVQTLYLMAFYHFLFERHGSGVGSKWAYMGLAVRLGVSMGLHRDAGRWNIGDVEIQRRRRTFWELYSYDILQCFTMGRPSSISIGHVDCKKPHVEDPCNEETFHWWKHRYISECMHPIYDQTFGAKMPTYNTILQLDRKLRSFPVPPILQIAGFGSSDSRAGPTYETVPLILQRHLVLTLRESNLLYMHRGFFAKAISDHPQDPLGSPYGSSFIAAYRSAGSLVALTRSFHSELRQLSERMFFMWTHLFSCSIVLGSIVTRCPSMSLAPSALAQLDSACDLFSKTAHIFHAEKLLAIMLSLRERAHASLSASRSAPVRRQGSLPESSVSTEEDELAVLGSRTRIVAQKDKSASPLISELSPMTPNPIIPFPLKKELVDQQPHPYVLEYLRTFAAHGNSHSVSSHQAPSMTPFDHMAHDPNMSMTPSFMQAAMPFQGTLSPVEGMPQSLPQYFPVIDYGYVGTGEAFVLPPEGDVSARSYSPETNMQTAWQDFVAQIS